MHHPKKPERPVWLAAGVVVAMFLVLQSLGGTKEVVARISTTSSLAAPIEPTGAAAASIVPSVSEVPYVQPSSLSPDQRRVLTPEAAPESVSDWYKLFAPLVDMQFRSWLYQASQSNDYFQCSPGGLSVELTASQAIQFAQPEAMTNLTTFKAIAADLPCQKHQCCDVPIHFRTTSTDLNVFHQVYLYHSMRFLYPIARHFQPKYILDAGGNAGFATMLFKLLWPEAVVVGLEPGDDNYKVYSANTGGFAGVHALNAGLWGHHANIYVATEQHGSWGLIFKEMDLDSEMGVEAFSIKDIMRMYNIPKFDLVKIDIEGAEGMVFGPDEDLSWLEDPELILMETHDFFAGYFGLEDVSSRILSALSKTKKKFCAAEDGEHLLLVSKQLKDKLPTAGGSQQ